MHYYKETIDNVSVYLHECVVETMILSQSEIAKTKSNSPFSNQS